MERKCLELVKLLVDLVEVNLRNGTEQIGFLFADTMLGPLRDYLVSLPFSSLLRKNKHNTVISAEAKGI